METVFGESITGEKDSAFIVNFLNILDVKVIIYQ